VEVFLNTPMQVAAFFQNICILQSRKHLGISDKVTVYVHSMLQWVLQENCSRYERNETITYWM
jgi:hypothetical protein